MQGGRLLVDAGWEMPRFAAQMRAYQIPFSEIRYVMFTHHHPDHAGLVQEVRDASGAKLIIHEKQIPFLKDLQGYYAKKGGYTPIRVEKDDLVSPDRAALARIGVQGEIVETPGHSDDSISLALDSGEAFIGDLPALEYAAEESYATLRASWDALIARHARVFYHSHTAPFTLKK